MFNKINIGTLNTRVLYAYEVTRYLWDSAVAEDALEHGDAAAYDDVVADVLHDGRGLPCHQGQEHGCTVHVPEQEQFSCNTSRPCCQRNLILPSLHSCTKKIEFKYKCYI